MRSTKTLLGKEARNAVKAGVNAVYEPTKRTFGPEGKNALLFRTFNRGPRITNDGVTVAASQEPKDPHVNLVSKAFIEACKKTNEKVGDGTTGTVIVAGKLYNTVHSRLEKATGGIMNQNAGIGVMTLKKNLFKSAEKVKEAIRESAKKIETIEQLEHIGTISSESEEIGKVVAGMAWEVGVDGFIDVVEGYKGKLETEIIKGMRFPAKVPAKGFLNNPDKFEMIATECPVILTNWAMDNEREMAQVLPPILQKYKKVVLISPSFSDKVLETLHQTMYQLSPDGKTLVSTGLYIYPVKAPSLRTDQYEDIAVGLGARFFNKDEGYHFRDVQDFELGFVDKLVVKDVEAKEDALAIGGKGEIEKDGESPVSARIKVLKGQLEETRQEQFKKLLERRIASLASAVGVIRVGASTDADALYQKLKIEDAVFACRSALRSGTVKGAGQCLKEISEILEDGDPLKPALLAPYEQIVATTGLTEIPDNVIDPADAIYYAVEHAVGVVANLATVDIITAEIPDPVHGEGEFAIARAIAAYTSHDKVKTGRLKANEEEMETDRMTGMSIDEHNYFDGEFLPKE